MQLIEFNVGDLVTLKDAIEWLGVVQEIKRNRIGDCLITVYWLQFNETHSMEMEYLIKLS